MSKTLLEEKIKENKALFETYHVNGNRAQLDQGDKALIECIFKFYSSIYSFELLPIQSFGGPNLTLIKINDQEINTGVGVFDFFHAYSLREVPEIQSLLVELNITEKVFLDFCETLFLNLGEDFLWRIKGKRQREEHE